MLRYLTSAARTSFRSLFTKPNASVYVSNRSRIVTGQMAGVAGFAAALFVGSAITYGIFGKKSPEKGFVDKWRSKYISEDVNCYVTKPMKLLTESLEAGSTEKPDPFKDGRVMFSISHPEFTNSTGVSIDASVLLTDISSDFMKICDGLEHRGIRVDRSEKGARQGLNEYAARRMLEYLKEHSEMKDDSRFSQTAFDDCRVRYVPSEAELIKQLYGLTALMVLMMIYMAYDIMKGRKITPVARLGLIASYYMGPDDVGMDKECRHLVSMSAIPVDGLSKGEEGTIKKRDPFENGKVMFRFDSPSLLISRRDENSDLSMTASVHIDLPYGANILKIHDGLKRRGIHVDRSKEGVRRGLTEYALKLMHEGVDTHSKKKCHCFDPSAPHTIPCVHTMYISS